MPDHIHLLLSIPPKYSVSNVVEYIKGKLALMIFDRHTNLKYKFGNRYFGLEGYYVRTAGLMKQHRNVFVKVWMWILH